ncbi:MAG: gamma-glutamyl-gamma-aminobutyrate hydrolase family protein [Planctomycetota bacterium]
MKRVVTILCFAILIAGFGCGRKGNTSAPVIGITSVYKTDQQGNSAQTVVDFAYVRAVADNGGIPVVLPTVDDEKILRRYLEELDGLVLVGGADIPPSAYGEQPHVTVEPLPAQRYDFERKLIGLWLAGGKPLLGVCLGMQFTNVVAGGTLIQDIPSQVGTKTGHRGYHQVHIEPGTYLAEILGAGEAAVYSNHHQAVKDVAKGFKVVAHSEDGVVEALERVNGGFGLFVQWHPEQMDDKQHRDAIYGALVRASVSSK